VAFLQPALSLTIVGLFQSLLVWHVDRETSIDIAQHIIGTVVMTFKDMIFVAVALVTC